MALGGIPPWLNVNPSDFVRAAQMGSEAGLAVARTRQAADQFAEQMQFRRWEAEQADQLRREAMQQRQQQLEAQQQARLAYNLANIGIRQAAQEGLQRYRESQKQHLADSLALQVQEETRRKQAEARRQQQEAERQKRLGKADEIWAKKEEIKSLYAALSKETDPPEQARLKNQIRFAMQDLKAIGGTPDQTGPVEDPYFDEMVPPDNAPAPVPSPGPAETGGSAPSAEPAWEQRGKWRIRKATGAPAAAAPAPTSRETPHTEDQTGAPVPPPIGSYSTAQGVDADTYEPFDDTEEEEDTDKEEK